MFRRRLPPAAAALAAFLLMPHPFAQQTPAPNNTTTPAPQPEWIDIPVPPTGETLAAPTAPVPEIRFPNFASCPIAEIQLAVPELKHLKAIEDQSQLAALLDKIGAKTVDIVRNTPNLISHELVVSEQNGTTSHADYSFLILQHTIGNSRVYDEYRVDVATGEKLQTDFIEKAAESASASTPSLSDLTPGGPILPHSASTGPSSQGFVNAWLDFYPANRKQFEFRYLGQQNLDRRQALVVAFTQKPSSLQLPATIEYNQRTYKIFMQGIAWIDPAAFRIVRLRTDLLSVPAGVPLHQLSVDIHFAQTSIADLPSPLWLPTQAVVTTNLAGSVLQERHLYSGYRLFRTRSKMVLK